MKYSSLSAQKRSKIFRCFAEDINAPPPKKTASSAGVNRSAVKLCFKELRLLIVLVQGSFRETAREAGAFNLDEGLWGKADSQ